MNFQLKGYDRVQALYLIKKDIKKNGDRFGEKKRSLEKLKQIQKIKPPSYFKITQYNIERIPSTKNKRNKNEDIEEYYLRIYIGKLTDYKNGKNVSIGLKMIIGDKKEFKENIEASNPECTIFEKSVNWNIGKENFKNLFREKLRVKLRYKSFFRTHIEGLAYIQLKELKNNIDIIEDLHLKEEEEEEEKEIDIKNDNKRNRFLSKEKEVEGEKDEKFVEKRLYGGKPKIKERKKDNENDNNNNNVNNNINKENSGNKNSIFWAFFE